MSDSKLQDLLIPPKPSGFNGHCRSKLSMAADAASLGRAALVPPVAGAVSAAIGAGKAVWDNVVEGHIGAAAGAIVSSVPAMAAGFFGGGAAADAAQGITNTALGAVGADQNKLPDSSAQNLMQDATCKTPKPPTSLTDNLPKGGKPVEITTQQRAKLDRMQMPGLY